VQLPRWAVRIGRFTRFGMLALAVLLIFVAPHVPVDGLEPFNAVFVRNGAWLYTLFGIVALLLSAIIRRFWCVMFCFDGALFELISRVRWKRPHTRCRRCPAPPAETP
jgi:polyferredoxin